MIVNKQRISSAHGFTVLELVLVILIVGVIAVTVSPKWTAGSQTLQYEARRVLNDIRYAQAMSISSGQRYRWVRTSSTTYQITNQAGAAIKLPDGNSIMTLTSNVSFGAFTNLPNNLVAFNSGGVPYTTTSIPGSVLSSTATIPLTSGSSTQNITITPTTGYGGLS